MIANVLLPFAGGFLSMWFFLVISRGRRCPQRYTEAGLRRHPRCRRKAGHPGELHEFRYSHDGVRCHIENWAPSPSAPGADPAAVRRLEEETARPLRKVIAEAERRAIAQHCPLDGDPRQAKVIGLEELGSWRVSGVPLSGGGGGGVSSTSVVYHLSRKAALEGVPLSVTTTALPDGTTGAAYSAALRDMREDVLREMTVLAGTAAGEGHQFTVFTGAEQILWDDLEARLGVIDARLRELYRVMEVRR